MEHGPLIDDFPIKPSIYKGFSMAMLNNQMVFSIQLGMSSSSQLTFIFFRGVGSNHQPAMFFNQWLTTINRY